MQEGTIQLDVGSSDEFTNEPAACRVHIDASLAALIRRRQAVVADHDIYSATRFNEAPVWLKDGDSLRSCQGLTL